MKIREYIKLFNERPCQPAVKWLESQPSMIDAWNSCDRGDWLWWALMYGKGTMPSKEISVQFAKWCAGRAYAAAAAAAADAERAAERKAQADWIREHIPYPFE